MQLSLNATFCSQNFVLGDISLNEIHTDTHNVHLKLKAVQKSECGSAVSECYCENKQESAMTETLKAQHGCAKWDLGQMQCSHCVAVDTRSFTTSLPHHPNPYIYGRL